MKYFPVCTNNAQHSDMCLKQFNGEDALQKGVVPLSRTITESFSKCNSLEDVIDGLLSFEATHLRSKSSSDLLGPTARASSGGSKRSCSSCEDILLINSKSKRTMDHAHSFNTQEYTKSSASNDSVQFNCSEDDFSVRINSCVCNKYLKTCKNIVKMCNNSHELQFYFSQIASKGAMQNERGCIKLHFSDTWCAESFCNFGLSYLEAQPTYVPLEDFEFDEHIAKLLPEIYAGAQKYNPNFHFILLVLISSTKSNAFGYSVKMKDCFVCSCAKLKLFPARVHYVPEVPMISTMILSAGPGNESVVDRTIREKYLINIHRKLFEKGVDLRRQHLKIYRKLIDFVAEGYKSNTFSPLIFYPYDPFLKSQFMCIIVPECEGEIEWIRSGCYCLFKEGILLERC